MITGGIIEIHALDFCTLPVKQVLEGIRSGRFDGAPAGKYPLCNGLDLLIQAYETDIAGNLPFEKHERSAEFIYIATGAERVLTCNAAALGLSTTPYEAEKDRTFYPDPAFYSSLLLSAGEYAVFLPDDGHKTRCNPEDKAVPVRKYMVKIWL
jgi:YhcH/YjgK/YiaL family protein